MSWKPRQKVVVPIDYSAASVTAIQTGIEAAESEDAVHVVHTLPELDPEEPFGRISAEYVEERREGAFRNLHDFLRRSGVTGVQTEILDGDPRSQDCRIRRRREGRPDRHAVAWIPRLSATGTWLNHRTRTASCPLSGFSSPT